MRLVLFPAFLLATAALATAQSPLMTTFANNNAGAVGGGIYFDLNPTDPAGVNICQFDLNFTSAAGTVGSINVYLDAGGGTALPHTQAWVLAGTGTAVAAGVGQPTNVVLASGIFLASGIPRGMAIEAVGLAHAYTNGTGAFPVPGNAFGTGSGLEMNAGQASNAFGVGGAFTPRIVNTNIYWLAGNVACPPPATVVSNGTGCVAGYTSYYEEMTTAAFDLAGGQVDNFGSAAIGYVSIYTPSLPIFPVGTLGPPTVLALPDDGQVASPGLLTVGSNGWVALGGGNSNAFVPNVGTMLNNPSEAWYSWKDINPASTAVGNGTVNWETNGLGVERVTFDNVYIFGGTTPADLVEIQFTYDSNTGNMAVAWGANAPANGTGWLVGYSVGGPSLDNGGTDVSGFATTVNTTQPVDISPLSLSAIGTPVQSGTANVFDVTTSDIPATGLLHLGIVGLSRPLLPLTSLNIAAPGCFLNASPDIILGPAIIGGATDVTWTALSLPAGPPNFFGFVFNCQGVVLGTPENNVFGLGVLTSNGLKCTVGGI